MNFDEIIDFRGTHSAKWDSIGANYGIDADDALAMWVADMDFRPPKCVADEVARMAANDHFTYFGDDAAYRNAIVWWMKTRHGWEIAPEWIFSVHGLGNGVGLCVDTYTKPGDAVLIFTPIYHTFARVIKAADRHVTECALKNNNGRYEMDLDAAKACLTGREKMVILCSPHNPGGMVWGVDELLALADFCAEHDLIIVSDEIHQDLVFGDANHTVTPLAAPHAVARTVVMNAISKTFNLAGVHTGNVIIQDSDLRARFAKRMAALNISPNRFGSHVVSVAYSPEGAQWVDSVCAYLQENHRVLNEGLAEIPGVKPVQMSATYLAWVDFSDTGLSVGEIKQRINKQARIVVNYGETFGLGGENFMRFNIACPKSRVQEAVARMQAAFADLQ